MKLHTQIHLEGHIEFKGGVLKLSERKRAVYHKQRGATAKSKSIVRTRAKVERAEVINKDNAIKFERSPYAKELKRIEQRRARMEARKAKRAK